MPELTLHAADNGEPVTWRVVRLARVVEQAEKLAASRGIEWNNALVELTDVEGELTAVWKDKYSQVRIAAYVERAWREAGESTDVCHEVLEQ